MKKSLSYLTLCLILLLLPLIGACEQEECDHRQITQTVVAPTCDAEGYTLNTCNACSLQYKTNIIAPKGHALSSEVVAPTCTKEGYTKYSCACGYQYQSDLKEPIGHTFSATTVSPTCEEGGYTTRKCTVCDFTYRSEYSDPLGHVLTEETIAPTCEEIGYVLSSCSVCAFSYKSSFLSPTGHTYEFDISHPTRTQSGAITSTCDCGYSHTDYLFYSDVFLGGHVSDNNTILAKGVDVSKWQHTVNASGGCDPLDWSAIKQAGFDFAILKAGSTPRGTQGGKDPVFEMNYRDAKAAGMELGVYFYTYATTVDGVKEDALLLISWLEDKQLEYPVYFDLEDSTLASLDQDTLTEFCVIFISVLQENGYYGALYSNNAWLTEKLHGEALKDVYDIWYARYPNNNETAVSDAYSWNHTLYGEQLGMWQYTQHGVIDGFDQVQFDFNYAYRDYPSIIKKYGYNGYPIIL